ncbi:hypothetical protein Cgig2_019659 [Carnegiea gigantea]|uniref:Uncharacterized protein n=1 Tax=Carnegiea gigantea TaxID=171969 RepID=A0A9Q1KI59_9CARY|nr:hypothetical protein Cgig2_019659 [Carnegiea gigantea]
MSEESEEPRDNPEPLPLATGSNLARAFQYYLDRTALHPLGRWLVTLGIVMFYALRVYLVKGFHVVSYGLATYVLNLLIGFLSPKVDPELEGLEGASPGKDSDEHRPFERPGAFACLSISDCHVHEITSSNFMVLYHQGFYTFINLDFHICVGCAGFLANIVKLLDLSTCGHYIPSNCTHSKVQVQSILDSKIGESFLLFAV